VKRIYLVIIGLLLVAQPTFAEIKDLQDYNGIGYFYDTETGFTWMDVDTFVSMSFNQVEAALVNTQFKIATYDDLRPMHEQTLAKPFPDSFDYWAYIIGINYEGSIPYIEGLYDNKISGQFASAWIGRETGPDWTYVDPEPTWMFPDTPPYDRDHIYEGMGAWVLTKEPFNITTVPEPSTLLLLCGGLVGLVLYRRMI